MLVRTWNLYHGNTVPPGRTAHLEEMVRLAAAAGRPAVLLLQELPLWSFPELEAWSGMQVFTQVAHRTPLGAALGGTITRLNPGLFRSAVSGQGNAILLDRALEPFDYHALVLNPLDFRKRQPVGLEAQLAWAKERRVLQVIRARLPDERRMLVGNLHATHYPASPALAILEVRRASEFFLALAQPGEIEILGGDFNLSAEAIGFLRAEGFSEAGPWVDHILVRGTPASPPKPWPEERRQLRGHLVSDHPPLQVEVT
jgi:endonuclease/exonuclease/phosphatase family metal-dependent hydrolase